MRKEAAQETADLREKMARMEGAFDAIKERAAPQEPDTDFDDDPAGYLKDQADQQQATLQQMQQQQQQQVQEQQNQAQFNDFMGGYQKSAAEFTKTNPDFGDAYSSLVEARLKVYEASGLNQQEAEASLRRDEIEVVQGAVQRGADPAEAIYNVAKAHGYKQAQAKPVSAASTEKIKTIEKGQKAATTLSGSGKTEGELSLEALADLEGQEFDNAWAKLMGSPDNIYN